MRFGEHITTTTSSSNFQGTADLVERIKRAIEGTQPRVLFQKHVGPYTLTLTKRRPS